MKGAENQSGLTWPRFEPGSAGAYAFATSLVFAASLIRWALTFVSPDIFIFAAYYPAVLFATYVGGSAVGISAAVLGAVTAWWAFIPHPLTPGVEVKLLAYAISCALIIWGADHYRRLMKRLEDEEKFRKLAVEELAHRLRNKLATIQSIISFQLRDEPQVRDAILGRLTALSGTDDLIMATQGQGASIRDILSAELRPYEVSRVSMEGPDCFLSPKLALTTALLVHELATNAAKYGALSSSVGKLTVNWSISDERLNLVWRENGGPIITTTPTHRGFGTRLLSRALDQFGGTVEMTFEPTGLICRWNVTLRTPIAAPETGKRAETIAADMKISSDVACGAHRVVSTPNKNSLASEPSGR